jgi:hypothetical protein
MYNGGTHVHSFPEKKMLPVEEARRLHRTAKKVVKKQHKKKTRAAGKKEAQSPP